MPSHSSIANLSRFTLTHAVLLGVILIGATKPAISAETVKDKAERVAQKTGAAIEYGAEKAKDGVVTAAQHTEQALNTAAEKTGAALKKTGEKIEKAVN